MSSGDVVARVVEAHGGARLDELDSLTARFSSGGLAFTSKGVPHALRACEATMVTRRERVRLAGARPRPWTASYDDADVLAARLRRLATGRRRFRWDIDDVATTTPPSPSAAGRAPRSSSAGTRRSPG